MGDGAGFETVPYFEIYYAVSFHSHIREHGMALNSILFCWYINIHVKYN